MIRSDFDEWRARYDSMTFGDHQEFWARLASEHPEQDFTHKSAALQFLREVGAGEIVELGGWKGNLASYTLRREPSISKWMNFDFAPGIVCDSRYFAIELCDFFWSKLDLTGFDTFVAGHVLEHLKERDLRRVLETLDPIKNAYVEMPIAATAAGFDWDGTFASHILEIGWEQVVELFHGYGFEVVFEGRAADGLYPEGSIWKGFSR